MPADRLLAPLRTAPDRAAILLDFDGTLSPTVPDPAAARLVAGAEPVVEALAAVYGLVAVVSGRPVSFLADHVPRSLTITGLYGLQVRSAGAVEIDHPYGRVGEDAVREIAAIAAEVLPGVGVEAKGLSLTLHFRTVPSAEAAVKRFADEHGPPRGLAVRSAKMSYELHPDIPVDKGTVVELLGAEYPALLYAGDDLGDMAAFDALDRFAAKGRHTVRVVVAGVETPRSLTDRADLVVDDPQALVELLAGLV